MTCSCCPYLYFGSAIMLVTYFVNFRRLNDHLFEKELFVWFTASAFRKLLSIYVLSYFPFGFESRMWDLIVSVPDHCLSFYLPTLTSKSYVYRHYLVATVSEILHVQLGSVCFVPPWKRLRVKMTTPILYLHCKKQDWWGIVKKSIMRVTVDFNGHRF